MLFFNLFFQEFLISVFLIFFLPWIFFQKLKIKNELVSAQDTLKKIMAESTDEARQKKYFFSHNKSIFFLKFFYKKDSRIEKKIRGCYF